MNIVEIPSFFIPYGGEFCIEQSKALAMCGNKVTILANVQLSIKRSLREYLFIKAEECISFGDVRCIRREMRGFPMVIKPNVKRWIKGVRDMFCKYVDENGKPDIIHAHCCKWAGYAAMLISREYGIPYVVTEHLSSMLFVKEMGDGRSDTWQAKMLRDAYINADMVIPVAAELVDDISRYFGNNYRWTEISNTIDTDFFCYHERKSERMVYRFCCLALFIPLKGYDVLFDAFDQLADICPNIELHIAGRGTDSKECYDMIMSRRNASKIKVHGYLNRQQVRELLYECDCLVLASRSEAQPLALLEAMSTGIPVVATECTPKSLRVKNGSFIVPINDVKSLCDMMKYVYENHASIDGKALSETIANMVSPKIIGHRITDLFLSVLK